ncbi:MAG: glycosyltransferase [Cytophagia bacterium]|nr:glycosyltransferase [Cytophagia bacterium]
MVKKVLLVGDNPTIVGGVTNYTRALFEEFTKRESIEVYYLYSSHRVDADNSFFKKTRLVNEDIRLYKIGNSKNLEKNYDHLQLDIESPFNDRQFEKALDIILPDVIHIHEMIGFSVNIVHLAKKRGIKVIKTIHEYWWLCPHRVMIDYNRRICDGPSDIVKCTKCVKNRSSSFDSSRTHLTQKLQRDFPALINLYKRFKNSGTKEGGATPENLSFNNLDIQLEEGDVVLKESLTRRLKATIEALNACDLLIGVSQDVKDTLMRFGVLEDRILVQHIGSLIGANPIHHVKPVEPNDIVIGYIGGITYYKGVHQLVEAYLQLPDEFRAISRLEIYGKWSDGYYEGIKVQFSKHSDFKEKINFHGRFVPHDLPEITNTMDISVLPSLCADTAPQTIFESFSSGLPIIAPNVGGFPDFVKDGVNGLLYEKANVESLRFQMQKIIERPVLLEEFKRNIPHIKSISSNADELISLYQ